MVPYVVRRAVRAMLQVPEWIDHREIDLVEACSALDHYAVVPLVKAEYCLCNFDPVGLAERCIVEVHSRIKRSDCKADTLLLLDLVMSDSAGWTRSSVDLREVVALAADPLSLAHTKFLDVVLACSDGLQMFGGGLIVEEVQGIVATAVDYLGPGSTDGLGRVGLYEQRRGLMSRSLPMKAKDDTTKVSAATHCASVFALVVGRSSPTMIGESLADPMDIDC